MEDKVPAERLFLLVAGVRRLLVPTDKLLPAELKEIKRCGFTLVGLEEGLGQADIDAWMTWIYVSVRRSDPTVTLADIEAAFADVPLVELMQSVERETPEVAEKENPLPPGHGRNESASETNGNGSGETTQALSTSETSGLPTSEIPN